ncbi:MAG: hypothetical protein EOP10_00825 [Proteobacteria bacterium]|nr:MAG: hypothetical protein EOP10_00825 [Pseudomonadota bacterium]
MKTNLSKVAWSLLAVTVVSLSLGKYFDSQCDIGCLFAEGKSIASKNGDDFNFTLSDDDYIGNNKEPRISGPLAVKLPMVAALQKLSYRGVSTEVKIRKGPALAVRAYDYNTDKKWKISESGNELRLDFQRKGPDRLEIDLPPDFKGALALSTVSGNLDIGEGLELLDLRIQSTSGDVSYQSHPAGDLSVNTVSGDISSSKVGTVSPKTVDIKSVSGDSQIELSAGFQRFKANTVSGDVKVSVTGKDAAYEYRMHSISGEFTGIPGAVVKEGIANRETDGKVGEPKGARLEFESISGDFQLN